MARFGSVFSMSVLDFVHLGSSLSLRSFARVGSSLSVHGFARFGSVFSMSVLDFVHLGSSLSLRSMARVGSCLSVTGIAGSGYSMSLLNLMHLGSSLSLRSFARLGSSVSVFGLTKISSCGLLAFTDTSYFRYSSNAIEATVNSARSLSMSTSGGGTLHGEWVSDTVLMSSDRQLKKDIADLAPVLARGQDDPAAPSWLLRELR